MMYMPTNGPESSDILHTRFDRTTRVKARPDWRWLIGAAILIASIVFAFVQNRQHRVDDGFISFQPDASLFPPAPTTDGVTLVGTGRPASWPDEPRDCPYDRTAGPQLERDWFTVRHDWNEGGEAKAWVISEHTSGFTNFNRYDAFVQSFRDSLVYCGWTYDRYEAGFNARLVELDGLPTGSFAFRVDASPDFDADNSATFGDSNPDEFRALGAVLPGRQRGQLMYVSWIGWGVDVPADQFVDAANTLYEAAHRAPDSDILLADDDTPNEVDVSSGRYVFDDERREIEEMLPAPGCTGDHLVDELFGLDTDSLDIYQIARDSARFEFANIDPAGEVLWATVEWEDRAQYLAAANRLTTAVGRPCINAEQLGGVLIEPVAVDELIDSVTADKVVAAKWLTGDNAVVAVATNNWSHRVEIIVWHPDSWPPSIETFVEIVNAI